MTLLFFVDFWKTVFGADFQEQTGPVGGAEIAAGGRADAAAVTARLSAASTSNYYRLFLISQQFTELIAPKTRKISNYRLALNPKPQIL